MYYPLPKRLLAGLLHGVEMSFLQFVWEDAETTQHLSVIVLLNSGMGETDLEDYKVEDEGRTLVIVVSWPSLTSDMERIHAYWEEDNLVRRVLKNGMRRK